MKGKSTFTKSEAEAIKELIRQKLVSDKETQKRIRDEIRAFGFYMTDFSSKKKYTVADFEKVVKIIDYDIDEHIHPFAVWTAARAASKSRLSNLEAAALIETVGLRQKVVSLRAVNPITDSYYHQWIRETGDNLVKTVKETEYKKTKKENFKTDNFTFGLAAKIISIYIKTVEVIPSKGESALSLIAYPPIDSILLKRINSKYGLNLKHQWSTFDWDKYEEVILKIKKYFDNPVMWKIEENWELLSMKTENK